MMMNPQPLHMLRRLPVQRGFIARLCAAALLAGTLAIPAWAGSRDNANQPMYQDPVLPEAEIIRTFKPKLKSLWLEALDRDQAELRRQAIQAFGNAFSQGMPNLDELPTRLLRLLNDDPHPMVRLAAARALVQFDAQIAAPALLEHNRTAVGIDMALIADEALARWDHQPARELWRQRLTDTQVPHTLRVSAIRALGSVKDTQSVDALTAIATDKQANPALRLAAGQSLGQIASQGLDASAEALAQGNAAEQVIAAHMLQQHNSAAAIATLKSLSRSDNPVAAAAALANLRSVAQEDAAALAGELLSHADPAVRLQAASALIPKVDAASVQSFASLLADHSPAVRQLARQQLQQRHAEPELQARVDQALLTSLGAANWRTLEQAAILAGDLSKTEAADQLIALVDAERWEVRVAAATALQQLAYEPTAAAIFTLAKTLADSGTAIPVEQVPFAEATLTQLVQTLGKLRYRPAADFLRTQAARGSQPGWPNPRSASVWALGLIYEGEIDPTTVTLMSGRVTDMNIMDPEVLDVQRFAAVALARMKANDQLGTLRSVASAQTSPPELALACQWAIAQLTGKPMPAPEPQYQSITGWFLEPAR